MHMLVWFVAAVATLTLLPGNGLAASGTALGVDPAAQAERRGTTQTLVVGADIFIGDRVVTGPSGQVQIRFSDRTELVVGPRSALVIEDYLLRENGSAGKLAIDALAGSFRFVTGTAPKNRYQITTPTGTIGVRGTAFDFFVGGGLTSILLYHGAVQFCTIGGACETLADTCDLGQLQGGQARVLGHTDGIGGNARDTLKAMFLYAQSQRPLLREFRVQGAERCLKRPPPSGGPRSILDQPQGGGPQDGPQQRPQRPNDPPPTQPGYTYGNQP